MKQFLLFVLVFMSGLVLHANVLYVDADATGANNGATWQDAYTNLSEAIEAAQSGDQVWVAAGVYYPTHQPNYAVGSADQRFNHFTLKNEVTLFGGFAGDESNVDERDLTAYKTVISGDIDQNDNVGENGYVTSYTNVVGENTYKLFYFPQGSIIDTTAVLDGFVLAGARAENSNYPYNGGAAMLCLQGSPKIINCEFSGNYAMAYGGAIYLENSAMVLENCLFVGNKAEQHGGAFYYTNSEVTLKHCEFDGNEGSYGGAMSAYNNASVSVFENCIFKNNVALDNAGVMTTGQTPNVFKNCTFTNNQAVWGGALVLYTNSNSEIVNCTFEGNKATNAQGGAIDAEFDSKVNIYNSTFKGNEAYSNGGAIYCKDGADLTAYNTLFTGNVNGSVMNDNASITNSGSAIYAHSSKVNLINNTLVANYSFDNVNGAPVNNWDAEMNIYNSVIWNNRGAVQVRFVGGATGEVNNSIIQDGYTGIGNIDKYPMFLGYLNPSTTPSTAGNFNLLGNSPANNKGINTKLPKDKWDLDNDGDTQEALSCDLNGNPRVFAGVVDIGCYEQQLYTQSGYGIGLWSGTHMNIGTSGIALNGTDFTIELWYFMQEGMNDGFHNIFGRTPVGANYGLRSPSLMVSQNDRLEYGYGDGTAWRAGLTEKVLKLNQWNHIALTFNDATNTMKVFANGKFLNEISGYGEVCSTPISMLNSWETLHGVIDEFRIWREERTEQELLDHKNKTLNGNEENLALYYNFDQITSGYIEDLTGSKDGIISEDGIGNLEAGLWNSEAIATPLLQNVTNVGVDGFTINWLPVTNASEYYIDVATDEYFNNLVVANKATNGATNYSVNGLSRGTVYYYKVTSNFRGLAYQYGHTATKLTPPGNALQFDGSTYVDATDVCKYDLTAGATIETWVNFDFSAWENDNAVWACNTNTGGNNYILLYSKSQNKFRLYYNGGEFYFDGSAVNENEWNHIALTINPGNTSNFYLNGVQTGSFSAVENPFPYGSLLSIGQEYDGTAQPGDTSNVMKGQIDEFRVWDVIRSQAEIQASMSQTLKGNEAGLITYYNFDQQTGTLAADAAKGFDGEIIGNANWIASTIGMNDFIATASLQNTTGFTISWAAVSGASSYVVQVATDAYFKQIKNTSASLTANAYNASGLIQGTKYYFRVITDNNDTSMVNYTSTLMEVPGNALWFDGKDDYVEVNQIAEQGSKANVTMECWAYVDPTETLGRFIAINTANGGNKYLLSYDATKGYYLYDAQSGVNIASNDTRRGAWVHLAVVMNRNSTCLFYVNGTLTGTSPNGYIPLYTGNQISFGQEFDGTSNGDFFKGALDEVRFWDGARTQTQIINNMHKKLTGNEAGLMAYYDFDQIEGQFVYEKVNGLDGTIISQPQWIKSEAIITPTINAVYSIGTDTATVQWNAIAGATDYKLELATDVNFENIQQTLSFSSETLEYKYIGLSNDTEYFVRVAAKKTSWSPFSLSNTFTTLKTPPGYALKNTGAYIRPTIALSAEGTTIEGWVKMPNTAEYLFYLNKTNFPAQLYNLRYGPSNKSIMIGCPNGSGNAYESVYGIDLIEEWNHIAFTFKVNSPCQLYINGKLVHTTAVYASDIDTQAKFASAFFRNAQVDEFRVWNKILSQDEIQANIHKTLKGNESDLELYLNFESFENNTLVNVANGNSINVEGSDSGTALVESKAVITPLITDTSAVLSTSFTVSWNPIPGASKYYLKLHADADAANEIPTYDSVFVGADTSYTFVNLNPNTTYYCKAKSYTDRYSEWSPSYKVKTKGDTKGNLAVSFNNKYLIFSNNTLEDKLIGNNAGAITGWFKSNDRAELLFARGGSGYLQVHLGTNGLVAGDPAESFGMLLHDGTDFVLKMDVLKGNDYYLDNQWHHFAVITGDGNNRILIDGEEQELHFAVGNKSKQVFSNLPSKDFVRIGYSGASEVFMDELTFYKNPISNQQVIERAQKQLKGDEVGLLGYYTFDNSNAADSSGSGRDGEFSGEVEFEAFNCRTVPFLKPEKPGVTEASLSWHTLSGATEYRIDIATDKEFKNKVIAGVTTVETDYRATGLTKNTKYYYHVVAKINGEWGEYSIVGEFYTIPSKAISFDGVDDYITANGINDYSSDEATIECWIKAEPTSSWDAIWANNHGTSQDNQYMLQYLSDDNILRIGTMRKNYVNQKYQEYYIPHVNLLDSWHHLAVTIVKNGSVKVYVDGEEKTEDLFTKSDEVTQINVPLDSITHHLAPFISGYRFSIGQEYDGINPTDFIKAEMDEFRVWDIALTQEQIRANMNQSEPEGASDHFIAHYTFDEILGDKYIDDLARSNAATLVNGPVLVPSTGVINPIVFNASDVTSGSFLMHVNQIETAASLEIEVAYDETFVPPLAVHKNIGKVTEYNVTDLCPGVKYYFRARALYGTDTYSEWGVMDTVWTIDEDAAILNLEASEGNYSQLLSLSWECTNNYLVTNFEIKRRIAGASDFEYLATVENNADFYIYTDSTAEPGTYYEYTVQGLSYCYDNDTKIDTSNIGFNIPMLKLSKEVNNDTQEAYIRLDWDYHPDFGKSLEIERVNTETGISQTFQEVIDSMLYKDGDVQLCVPYNYQLIVNTKDFNEVKSHTHTFVLEETLKGVFDTLDATKGYSDTKITLTWTSHKQNIIDEYQINRRKYDQGQNWQVVKIIDKGTTQVWIDEDANPGEYYEYMIVAVGTCGENTLYSDSTAISVGFRQPEGVIAGQVNYKGGNPVKHVRLVVNYDEANKIYGRCLQFNGNDDMLIKSINTFDLSKGLTFESWIRPTDMNTDFNLFMNSGITISYEAGNLKATTGGALVQHNIKTDNVIWQQSSWNHIAVSANADSVHLLINGQLVSSSVASTSLAFDAVNYVGDSYTGYIDEMRIWNFAKSDSLLARHRDLLLPRDEANLICALRFDEGLGVYAFDHTRINDIPNKSHATIYGAQWSDAVPSLAKLALAAKTEMNGNYIVKGIWFKGSGETFSITPAFGVHEFDPATKNMLISENSLVYNGQDFTDISAFLVTGDVYYKGTGFPVEGVNVLVDGSYIMNSENMPVATNELGQFELEVPIGDHYLSLFKDGHVFSEGYFPPKVNGEIQYHNFQDDMSGLHLIDSTTYKLVGRIVGGRQEGDKEIGFGNSVNNIGQYTVRLTTTKGYELDESGNDFVEFTTDISTGEYEIQLLPEVYASIDVSPTAISSHYSFNNGDIIDMSESHMPTDVYDTLYMSDRFGNDSVVGVNTYSYNVRKDWVYRSIPSLDVTNTEGGKVISDLTYTATDADGNEVVLDLVDDNGGTITYPFGKPIFHYGGEYNVLVSVFEEYENYQNSVLDRVPVTHGNIQVTNELSTNPSAQSIELTDSGKVLYTFYGGFPNLSVDNTNPALSYTKKMEIKAFPENGTPVAWEPASGSYYAYLMGAKATGNNFVTTGPNEVKFILRDPPGSNSYAYYEAGFTTSESTSFNIASSSGQSMNKEVSFSPTINFSVGGFGFEKQTEIAFDNGLGTTQSTEITQSRNMEWNTTTTYMSSYQTSDDPAYVGTEGDLFFGNSTNIVYGLSNFLEIMPTDKAINVAGNEVNGFSMGTRTGMRLNPEFGTMFIYSQNHIENYLIPNLKILRNLQLANFPNKYEAVFTNVNDDKYGTDNDDKTVWGAQASTNKYNGPSYIFHALPHDDPNWHIDSVRFFNQQIRGWEDLLARNEWEKVNAQSMINNISFDAGAVYESSITTATESSVTTSFEINVSKTIANTHGVTVDDVGATFSMERTKSRNTSFENNTTNTSEKTVGFVLADGDQGDYFTVDVKKCRSGNGPVFITRGGQSSCPYEGEDLTEYYEPGQHTLNFATMRIEVPEISAVENAVINVPETDPAYFTLKISNQSEAEADNWFMVKVDAASNPHGAKVKIDGGSMNSGVAILVPAGTTLTKTLEIEKGRPDVNEYEDINIIMHSLCQFDPTDDAEDIVDTVTLSAYFVPVCTPVEILKPDDNWLVNVNADDQLKVQLGGYNLQHATFEKMALQYKPESGSVWFTQAMFFNDTSEYASYTGDKAKIDGQAYVDYVWNTKSVQDRNYQMRAVTYCTDNSTAASDIYNGIIDGNSPQVFGTPSPADGILDPNDDIVITFNEPIEAGLILPHHIQVEGVLNGSEINHGTSVAFDGEGDYVVTPEGLNLDNSSYSIEFWMQKDSSAAGTIISQGTTATQQVQVAIEADSIALIVNAKRYKTANKFTDNNWHHYAVVYNNKNSLMQLYIDDQIAMEQAIAEPTSTGSFWFGKSGVAGNENYLAAKVHDVRVWKRALAYNDVIENMNVSLSGNEIGLAAYWPMDEGEGNILLEKAHSRNATMYATWSLYPLSSAYEFDGVSKALAFKMGSIPVTEEMDYTIEFWMKGGTQNAGACIFSNGNATIDAYLPEKTISFELADDGQLQVKTNNEMLSSGISLTDDAWHHIAFAVNRRAYASLFIDGEKVESVAAANVGSMQNSHGFIGARGYIDNTLQFQLDNFFNGSVDELRIWKVARKQEQISLYEKSKLNGAEVGLAAYFPFENYTEVLGVLLSEETLIDQSINQYSGENNCDTLLVFAEESFTKNSPAMKRQRPKQAVNFDYVIGEDKIVITPKDGLAKIENCVLEISVQGVQDLHGNAMASPATWTAYVNKNQVVWGDDMFTLEKEISESLSFTTTIVNEGGVQQSFSITNLPNWLTVSPEMGTLEPDSETEVEFTVNDALNIGNYSEDIFLSCNSGYNEKLTIDLRVFKEAPNWVVNETAYQSSMNIIAQLSVKDVISNDKYDKIGVFSGDVCRGVCNLEYKANYDAYFAFLVVYGNTSGEELSYRVWDASEGKIYSDVAPTYNFEPNKFYGTIASPVLFTAGNKLDNTVELNKGWNWLSFNLEMAEPSVKTVFDGLSLSAGDIVKHAELFSAYDASSSSWIGSLNKVDLGKLYRANIQQGGKLLYMGAEANVADNPITIVNGWNRIGYIPSENMTVNEALAGFEPQVNDVIKSQYQFAMYDGYEWIGSLNYMEAGKGYMYQSNNTDTVQFVYPKASALSNKSAEISEATLNAGQFEYVMNVTAKVLGANIPENAKLEAFVNGELRGTALLNQNNDYKNYSFITVYGSEDDLHTEISFKLKVDNLSVDLEGISSFVGNAGDGDLFEPVELNVVGALSIADLGENALMAYPNPFSREITLHYSLNEQVDVKVEVYNILGDYIEVLINDKQNSGNYSIKWDGNASDGRTVKQGVYFIHITAGALNEVIRVVKE